jgi:hypothetical protein
VGDEEHGATAFAPVTHHVEHAVRKIGRQRRRDLVEDQQLRVVSQRARKVEHAKDGERQIADELAEADLEAHLIQL